MQLSSVTVKTYCSNPACLLEEHLCFFIYLYLLVFHIVLRHKDKIIDNLNISLGIPYFCVFDFQTLRCIKSAIPDT